MKERHHLRHDYLTFPETIAQSFANIAPTLTPALAIPLVAASAGAGTWLTFLIATVGLLLVGLNVAVFSKRFATSGSFYRYVRRSMGPTWGFASGWAMIFAYLGTAMAVLVACGIFANLLAAKIGFHVPQYVWYFGAMVLVWALGYKDIKLSSILALLLEFASVGLILSLGIYAFAHSGFKIDTAQLTLKGVHVKGIQLGMVLAVFSFVGFESAATLGKESKQPFKTIPRAVLLSAGIAGAIFIFMSYVEISTFPGGLSALSNSTAPLNSISKAINVGWFGTLIDLGAMISLFSCTLASVNAASRVMFTMARDSHFHSSIGEAHHKNRTPHIAVSASAVITIAGIMALYRSQPLTAYAYFGTIATYGFFFVYIMISIAAPKLLKSIGELKPVALVTSVLAILFMAIPVEGSLYPIPAWPWNLLPYIFLAYMILGFVWYQFRKRSRFALELTELNQDIELVYSEHELELVDSEISKNALDS